MTALVTGGTGFVGSHLVELLLARQYKVRCLVRRSSDIRWLRNHPVEYVYGDLFDDAVLKSALKDVDYVYHSAGVTKAKTKEEYYRGNVEGTRNLLRATERQCASLRRFVHVSSQTAVGPSPSRTPIKEDHPSTPLTTYGQTKWEAEIECSKAMSKLPITICRPPAVYGPRDKDIFEYFNTMKKGLQPSVGFHEKYVSLIHVSDLVRGLVMSGESEKSTGQVYFISSKNAYGWREIGEVARRVLSKKPLRIALPHATIYGIAAVAEFFGLFSKKPVLLNFEKARDMVQDYWTCDSSKAYNDFGFEQQISLEEGFTSSVEWYRRQGWL